MLLEYLNNENTQNTFDMIDSIIYWKDCNGQYLGCNLYFIKVLGLVDKTQLIGKGDKSFLINSDAHKVNQNGKIAMKNGQFTAEECITINIKNEYYLSNKSNLIDSNGKAVGVFCIATNITKIKNKTELDKAAAILEEQAKHAQIIDMIPANIYWKHGNESYIGCNKHQKDIIGFDIVGKNEYDIWSKEEADKIHEIDQYVLDHGSYFGEEIVTEADGKMRNYFTSKVRLFTIAGKKTGIIGISIDVTAQKEAEQLKHENRKLEAQNKLNQIILEKEAAESERLRLENALHKLENDKHQAAAEEQEKFKKFVGQIVHDIKSPLASLRGVVNESSSAIPEEKRITLRQASMRISDIAQHMLSRYKNEIDEEELAEPVLASAAMLEVISEKRYEHPAVNFDTDFKIHADFAFIRIEPGQFKRMISNLLNNAVEALENKPDEKIGIRLNTNAEWVIITLSDSGKGMTKELIDKINSDLPVTEGKKHGSGIGLTHAREAVQRNFGKFEIYSTMGHGTSVILRFPKILSPAWIAEEIKITKSDIIVILDDDTSIHGAWDLKLVPILSKLPRKPEIKHFAAGSTAVGFINSFSTREKNKICLLTDYELLNQDINGLQVIEQTKIKRAILVTSHYANPAIREQASNLRVKILPKDLAFAVPINLDQKIKPGSKKVDMVCVDDDLGFVHGYVERFFPDLRIDMYSDPDIFLENVEQYPMDTKIILDHFYSRDWGPKVKYFGDGVEVAIKLNKKGFTKLFMLTGEEPNPDSIPPYLTVILKDDDEKIKNIINL